MVDQISIDDAQGHLKDMIAGLAPGAELVITDDDKPVANWFPNEKSQPIFANLGLAKA